MAEEKKKAPASVAVQNGAQRVVAVVVVTSVLLMTLLPVWLQSTTPERNDLPAELQPAQSASANITTRPIHNTLDSIVSHLEQIQRRSHTHDSEDASCFQGDTVVGLSQGQSMPLCRKPTLLISILNARPEAVFAKWDDAGWLRETLLHDTSLQQTLGSNFVVDFHTQAAEAAAIQARQQEQQQEQWKKRGRSGRQQNFNNQAEDGADQYDVQSLLPHIFQTVGSVQTTCTVNLGVYIPNCPSSDSESSESSSSNNKGSESKSFRVSALGATQSFWQPGWGGVIALPQTPCTGNGNGAVRGRAVLRAREAQPHFAQFLRHMLNTCHGKAARGATGSSVLSSEEEVQGVQVQLVHRYAAGAGKMLSSLAALLESLPTLVVDRQLAHHVDRACQDLAAVQRVLGADGSLDLALLHARSAHHYAGMRCVCESE